MATSERNLERLKSTEFDVLIVGGGISGAWLALHCAQSGYRTALIERGDYASETSSSSSKLLHGGIRYLQQMQFGKVRESAFERAQYLFAAPHLTKAVPFIIPTYKDFPRSKFFLNCGMLAYQVLCMGENKVIQSPELELSGSHSISRVELNQLCDLESEPHTGGVVFYERHMVNSERMVLAILQTSRDAKAEVHNYISAIKLTLEGDRVNGVLAQDHINEDRFEIKSKLVINAAGPWIDSLNSGLRTDHEPSITGFAIGSHIVSRQLSEHAIALTSKHQSDAKLDRGGRHVFVIPWRGLSLIGTSYDDVESLQSDLSIQSSHVQQLLDAINQAMPSAKLTRADLISGYSGLYPLRAETIQGAIYQGSGEYQIIDHERSDNTDGVITAFGAKFTTGRKLSALTMKLVAQKLGKACNVSKTKLHNSEYASLEEFSKIKLDQYSGLLPAATIELLISHYGSDVDVFIDSIGAQKNLLQPIVEDQPDILGQVVWAVEREQAQHLNDVLFRRTSSALLGITEQEVTIAARVMASVAGWDGVRRNAEIDATMELLNATNKALAANADRN